MGIIELDKQKAYIFIRSQLFFYGNAISEEIRRNAEDEINELWNAPRALIWLDQIPFLVQFETKVFLNQNLQAAEILANRNPGNNYIRVEEKAYGNISFVDGNGSNTGYFKLENLYKGSTTVAHEYGHTLGLDHPQDLDLRGKGQPAIMYPRGTLVDAQYQYNPSVEAGSKDGGTMHPKFRKVYPSDIENLQIKNLIEQGHFVIGKFSSKYHEAHLSNEMPSLPPWVKF